MEPILDQIRATFDCGIWYPVVSSVLMMPDACGAVEFWGQAKRPSERYVEWYDRWVLPHFNPPNVNFGGSVVYKVRNAMIHESTSFARGIDGFDRVLFVPCTSLHFNLMQNNAGPEDTFTVSIQLMMDAMESAVRNWLSDVRSDSDTRRQRAIANLIQFHPDGLHPYIGGVPVVA